MHYEEKIIDEVLCYREDPKALFTKCTDISLTNGIMQARANFNALSAEIKRLRGKSMMTDNAMQERLINETWR
ncbi:MAG: hypothetical protein KAR42_15595 [candidate division Zixibacteria bacterium]|nr:hypothetical protein [candidate division Zixibacteria bacterium]